LPALKENLLVDIEFWRHMVGVGLACRRLEWPEMGTINLVTLHEANVLQTVSYRFNRLDDISKHGEIRWHELGPSRPILVGRIENVGYIGEVSQFLPAVVSIEQIYRNVPDTIGWFSAAPR
jgi:hypothetical protein